MGWGVLEPLLQFALYLVVFGVFLGIRFAGKGVATYGVFLVSGLVPFLFLQEVVVRALGLAHAQSRTLRQSPLPPEVLLAGVALALVGKYLVGLVLVCAAALAVGVLSWATVGWLVVGCILLFVASFGAGLMAFPVGAFLPDAAPVVTLGLNGVLFLSPVFYPLSSLPKGIEAWLQYNPMVGVLECFRAALTGAAVRPEPVLLAAAVSCLILAGGNVFFQRRARYLREVV